MEAAQTPLVFDATEADFEQLVVERSRTLPVLVDFWAEWCAPCRALGPALERAVTEREGKVELAKVDVDSNPGLSARFRVQGIPAVKAFRHGQVASEFTGAVPPARIESFLDELLPSEAAQLAARAGAEGDEDGLRRALELDPRHPDAAIALARLLLRRGEPAEALGLVEPLAPSDFVAAGLLARAELELEGHAPSGAFAAWDTGDHARALELMQQAVASEGDADRRNRLRAAMVGQFTELGADDPLVREHRRRLAAALS
jgi:putative thioredoxin